MMTKDIVLNGIYENKQGQQRQIIAEGPQYVLYSSQMETDNIRYRVIRRSKLSKQTVGTEGNMTRSSFAAWAARRLQ